MRHAEEPEGGKHEPDLEEIYKKTHEIAEYAAIDIDEFRDLYGDDIVDRDEEEIKRLETEFERARQESRRVMSAEEWLGNEKKRELAEIFEAVFYEHAEMSDWLGPNATVTKASRYDDIKNGVDSIVEFAPDEDKSRTSHLALAVDVTTSRSDDVIWEKIARIKQEISSGSLTRVKYFKSENLDIRGELQNVPRTIIMADAWKTAKELGALFVKKENKKLAEHPIQHQIIDELLLQFRAFGDYAKKEGQEDIYRKYKRLADIVLAIKKEKEMLGEPSAYDEGYEALRQALSETFQ